MLRPRIPVNPLPTGIVTPLAQPAALSGVEPNRESSPMARDHHDSATAPTTPARTTVQLTPGSVLALAAGGGAVVLVVGTVLVSMLLAVAISAASVAVCAVVIRSLLNNPKGH
ncbi:SpdD-like protein [Streptomyces sp. NBC_00320]|uniref:SpdD-like protein n=1 Tax=Streptomyces sp. NBC_00320 TaxID=2975711 RepID=UPI00225AB6C9|nr:SpdD-like protein [Streptomyces sp. NBC_00320]MCX5147221.1 SpdD-like protein [Streptomyces sp. NBC_00320]